MRLSRLSQIKRAIGRARATDRVRERGGCVSGAITETETGIERETETQKRRRKALLSSSHQILAGLPRRIFTSLPLPTFSRVGAYTEKLGWLARLECMRKCVHVCGRVGVCLHGCLCVHQFV